MESSPDPKDLAPSRVTPPRDARIKCFSESNVDGFVDDKPQWLAYCEECGIKLSAEDHKACPYQGGTDSEAGDVVSFRCSYCRS